MNWVRSPKPIVEGVYSKIYPLHSLWYMCPLTYDKRTHTQPTDCLGDYEHYRTYRSQYKSWFEKIDIIPIIISSHSEMRLETNHIRKAEKFTNVQSQKTMHAWEEWGMCRWAQGSHVCWVCLVLSVLFVCFLNFVWIFCLLGWGWSRWHFNKRKRKLISTKQIVLQSEQQRAAVSPRDWRPCGPGRKDLLIYRAEEGAFG